MPPHYTGLFASVELRLEQGQYHVVLEPCDKVLSFKAHELMPVDASVSRHGAAGAEGGGLSECIKEADSEEAGAREVQEDMNQGDA